MGGSLLPPNPPVATPLARAYPQGGGAVIFVWSSPTFGGKTGHEDLFFGLHRIWGVHERIVNCPKVPMNKKLGNPAIAASALIAFS